MSRNRQKETSSLVYLKVFLIFIFACIFISIILKLLNLIQTSRFDSDYFNIFFISKKNYIFNIKQNENTISVIEVKPKNPIKFEKFSKSQLSIAFGVPIDAVIFDKIKFQYDPGQIFNLNNSLRFIINPFQYKTTGINRLDILKIYFAFSSVLPADYKTGEYDLSDQDMIGVDINGWLYNFFKDKNIISDGISVEVVNNSDISGAGAKVTRMLKNIGYNIVSVSSSDKNNNGSQITCRIQPDYSTDRINTIFSIPFFCKPEAGIADITIDIGKDYKRDFCSALVPCGE